MGAMLRTFGHFVLLKSAEEAEFHLVSGGCR
jgi:hypothetical protein